MLTGVAWMASAGVFFSKEVLPTLRIGEKNVYENLLGQLSPYEEWWYGLYYSNALCGGLRLYYEVIEDGAKARASLRPSLWCYPLFMEGSIELDTHYRIEGMRWQFRWHDVKGMIHGNVDSKSGVINWRGKVGDKEVRFRTPYPWDATPSAISISTDTQGVVQEVKLPGGFILKKEPSHIVMASMKKQNSSAAVQAAIEQWENGIKTFLGEHR